jgi:hypothetical protein
MVTFDQTCEGVRKLLRLLRRPYLLPKEPLAQRLRDSLGTESCHQALLQLIDLTFAAEPEGERLREILIRSDIHAQKARVVAAAVNLSLRQFFRRRAQAIEALATTMAEIEHLQRSRQSLREIYCTRCKQRIADENAAASGWSSGVAGV